MAEITVIGSFVMDNVAKMSEFPGAGQTVLGKNLELFPGGKGANQCVAVARLGGDVEMVGMLGKDENGEAFRRIFAREGIPCHHVFSCEKPTAVAQVQINDKGENRICVIPSANYEFGFSELDKIDGVLRKTKLAVLQLEMRLDVTKELIRRVHGYGVAILLNPAPAVRLEREILSKIDYLTPNETELSVLSGLPTETDEQAVAAAERLLRLGTKTVVATLGARGALIVGREGAKFVPGYKVAAVDTVAAGDSFNGALAVALREGKSLFEAVRFANAMGALTVQKAGAIPSLAYRDDVENFLREHRERTND